MTPVRAHRPGIRRVLASRRAFEDVADALLAVPRLEPHGEAPQATQMRNDLRGGVRERTAASAMMAQRQRAVAIPFVADYLDVRDADVLRVLLRKELAHALVAALVVDAVDDQVALVLVIGNREQMEV